jgi:hypothetical protein
MKIQIAGSLGDVPAIASQGTAVHERLPRHPVFRGPSLLSQHGTDFLQRWPSDVDVHVPHCSRRPRIESNAECETFGQQDGRIPAQLFNDGQTSMRQHAVFGERGPGFAAKLIRQFQGGSNAREVSVRRCQEAQLRVGGLLEVYFGRPRFPHLCGDVAVWIGRCAKQQFLPMRNLEDRHC